MTAPTNFATGIPDDQLTAEVRSALARLADENALLRAALNELRSRVAEFEEGAERDPLTGLANRKNFLDQLERSVSQAERHGTPAALLSIDLRGLDGINRNHGRIVGDAALTHVARLLKDLIRSSDVAARTEGAVFSLLLDHLDSDSAIDTGDRIARCIADNPLDLGGARVALEATVAVTTILPGDTVEDILHRAERNLERVKEF